MNDVQNPSDRGRQDVEKRWQDTGSYRSAALYVAAVVGVGAIACAIFLAVDRTNMVLGSLVPGVFVLGGIGALVIAYRTYRRGGTWPMWQGAAWFLFALMLVSLAFPAMAG
ncbi:hypothetical protein [Gordonia metallireducens]|uniref:hypothetical protein n=1 Tax=Gordonia metallireducens TaxID=2897779 RepID=UPI001E3B358A|nr:hypothetical protein [Gordonia metallireducens]